MTLTRITATMIVNLKKIEIMKEVIEGEANTSTMKEEIITSKVVIEEEAEEIMITMEVEEDSKVKEGGSPKGGMIM